MDTIELNKNGHRFIIRYETACACLVLDALVDMVLHKRELGFDWFDAAVLSHQLGVKLKDGIDFYAGGDATITPI